MGMTNEQAVADYGWLVERIARQYARPGFEVDDLVQEGYLGLFEAVKKWKGGGTFKSYASLLIRSAVCKTLSADAYVGGPEVISMDASVESEGEKGITLHDIVGEAATQEIDLGDAETDAVVRDAISLLPQADRQLIYMTLKGQSQDEIGKTIGVTQNRVHELYRHTLAKLTRLLHHRVQQGAPRTA